MLNSRILVHYFGLLCQIIYDVLSSKHGQPLIPATDIYPRLKAVCGYISGLFDGISRFGQISRASTTVTTFDVCLTLGLGVPRYDPSLALCWGFPRSSSLIFHVLFVEGRWEQIHQS